MWPGRGRGQAHRERGAFQHSCTLSGRNAAGEASGSGTAWQVHIISASAGSSGRKRGLPEWLAAHSALREYRLGAAVCGNHESHWSD
jgi:hypothetical protein